MLPSSFDYRAPTGLEEALSLLGEHGDDAKVLAGGQSLIPLLKLRLASPAMILDIGRVPGLESVDEDGGGVRIGARTTHATLAATPRLATLCSILAEAAPQVSDPLVRNMGTVGGSLCHADPQGDWASVMLALDAHFTVRSTRGERTIAADALITGPFTTSIEPDEVMVAIHIPAPRGRAAGTYLKLERKIGDFATVGVAVQVDLDDGHIARAGIGLTAVGPTNLRATAAERALAGEVPTDEAIAEAARLAADAAEPRDDVRGSAAYKKDVVRVFVQRGLRTALLRAREGRA